MPSTRPSSSRTGKARIAVSGWSESGGRMQRHRRGNGLHVARHDVADPGQRKRIDAIFAHDMVPAPGDLLGQDRAAHQQHRHRMGRCAGGDQRQRARGYCRSARPQRTSPSAARAWCRPSSPPWRAGARSRGSPRQEAANRRAHRAAHDQQRREHAAGSSGTERDRPDVALTVSRRERQSQWVARRSMRRYCRSRRRARADRSGRRGRRPVRRASATTSNGSAA